MAGRASIWLRIESPLSFYSVQSLSQMGRVVVDN